MGPASATVRSSAHPHGRCGVVQARAPVVGLGDESAAVVEAVVYKTATCPQCGSVLGWLDAHGVPYTTIPLEEDAAARERVMAWNGGFASVPTLDLVVRLTEPTAAQLTAAMGL